MTANNSGKILAKKLPKVRLSLNVNDILVPGLSKPNILVLLLKY